MGRCAFEKLELFYFYLSSPITAIRLPIIYLQKPIEQPKPEAGVLDLRGWTLPHDRAISLDGEWAFYPWQLLTPDGEGTFPDAASAPAFIHTPGAWDDAFPEGPVRDHFRYGTYRLRILLNDEEGGAFKLRATEIRNASAVYVDGRLVAGAGQPSEDPDKHRARLAPVEALIHVHDGVIDIVIPVSSNAGEGGITMSTRFGTDEAVDRYALLSVGQQVLLCVVLLVHALYALMLYWLGPANRGLVFFSLLIVCAIGCVLTADDRLLFVWFPMPYETTVKIALLSYIGVSAFIPSFLKHMFPEYGSAKAIRLFLYLCGAYGIYVLAAPSWLTLPTEIGRAHV